MQIKRYRGTDMQEALQKVKKDLGTDAIILSTRKVRSGGGTFGLFGKPQLEVTAARDGDFQTDGNSAAQAESSDLLNHARRKTRLLQLGGVGDKDDPGLGADQMRNLLSKNRVETQQLLAPLQDDIQELKDILQIVGDSQRGRLHDDTSISQIRAELGDMRSVLQSLSAKSNGLREANYPENLVVLYQQMIFNGLEEKFARRLTEEANKNIPLNEVEDFNYVKIFLARMLMKIVKVDGGIKTEPDEQKIVVLVGPTGVGKTTTLAKLASEQHLKHNKQVALITVDTFRIAAVEQLKVYAKILSLPVTVVNNKTELRQAIRNHAQYDVIFIDTAGRSQWDDLQMVELRNLLAGEEQIDIALTLSSTTKDSDQTDITRRFGELPISSVYFTKLDESTTYGSLFNHAIRFKRPISYLATGQKVPEDIEVATKERLVDLMLNISGD